MEGTESKAIFESLNLNPQLFINEVLNLVDDLFDGAFDFYQQEASNLLKTKETDRSGELNEGIDYIRNMIQGVLDKRLEMWEKYCLKHCFAVPEGFSMPKASETPGDSSINKDVLSDLELDAQLDSLRDELTSVAKESAKLNRELQTLERQSTLSNQCTGSVNEALHLYEQSKVHDMFQEMIRTASELRTKMEEMNAKRMEGTQRQRVKTGRIYHPTRDLSMRNHGKGLFNAGLEDLQEFLANLKSI